jgi:hypothetical protein
MNLVLSITILASKLNRRVLSVLCVLKIAPKDDFNRKHIGILWCVVFGLRTRHEAIHPASASPPIAHPAHGDQCWVHLEL